MPLVFGPTMRMPLAFAIALTSASRARPSSVPNSENPVTPMITLRTPAAAQSRIDCTVPADGITISAQSMRFGVAPTEA